MKNKFVITFCTILILVLLFVFPKSSFTGAKNGLLLWFNVVLPTLLPFVIVSNLIIQFQITQYISFFFQPILCKLLHISKEGCYPVIIGMLSGYPIGAKACADLVTANKITKKEGQFLLSFCNNASPMFISSYITLQCLHLPQYQYRVLGILILSAILSGILYRFFLHLFSSKKEIKNATDQIVTQSIPSLSSNSKITVFEVLDNSIFNGFEVLNKIGGYIVLFSFMAQIIYDLPVFSFPIKSFLIGCLEITTGTDSLASAPLSSSLKIVLIMSITAFGGFSSLAQTQSVIQKSGLSIKKYMFCKIMNAFLTALLTFIFLLH